MKLKNNPSTIGEVAQKFRVSVVLPIVLLLATTSFSLVGKARAGMGNGLNPGNSKVGLFKNNDSLKDIRGCINHELEHSCNDGDKNKILQNAIEGCSEKGSPANKKTHEKKVSDEMPEGYLA